MIKEILINFGSILCDILSTAIFVQILMSWIVGKQGRAYAFLDSLTSPLLNQARKLIPPTGMLDFSPIMVMLALEVIKTVWTALIMMI